MEQCAVFPFFEVLFKTDVTLLIKFNEKHGAVCANHHLCLNAAHHLWFVYLFMSFWAKICTSHCYSVLLFWFVQIVGKKSRIKTEKEENERPFCCFYGKIKWNIKHIVLGDTNWTWLNEKPHYINYVRDFFEAQLKLRVREKGRLNQILVRCPVCGPGIWTQTIAEAFFIWANRNKNK